MSPTSLWTLNAMYTTTWETAVCTRTLRLPLFLSPHPHLTTDYLIRGTTGDHQPTFRFLNISPTLDKLHFDEWFTFVIIKIQSWRLEVEDTLWLHHVYDCNLDAICLSAGCWESERARRCSGTTQRFWSSLWTTRRVSLEGEGWKQQICYDKARVVTE